ncbi:uncharacterized protein [Haliotis asinina]|uniref:uncharacterized protein n=1 Tax=Haliotis asinina TaxID=109174 RepID=UPI0035326620
MATVLNESDVYPLYGDFGNTWCQTSSDYDPWIELGFGRLIYVVEIRIFETHNAGHAKNISLRNSRGEWEMVWRRDAPTPIQAATVFVPDFQPLTEQSDAIHLAVFKDAHNKYIQIDAIKVLGHD